MDVTFFTSGGTVLLKASIGYFKALNQLQIAVFNCYIHKEYRLKSEDFDQKIHQARIKLLRVMKKIRSQIAADSQCKLIKFENMYEIIFSLNTLKLRIADHATFEMCEKEFKRLSHGLSNVINHIIVFLNERCHQRAFNDPKTHYVLDDAAKIMGNLSHHVDAFEELYRSTLQVVSQDPIFFLFFVQDLIALRDELESFLLGLLNDESVKK